jgi:hypothetical protein
MYEQKPKFGPVAYKAGEVIIRQGDIPDKFYIITSGQVEVLRRDDEGNRPLSIIWAWVNILARWACSNGSGALPPFGPQPMSS